jgi:endonuclease/exonuclease/phosphatase family metal-dependent hydrolase
MRLRVLTYNIHRAIGVDRRFRPERIVDIVAHHAPDVALLQEVDDGAPRSRGLDLARELAHALGYAHYAVGHNVTLRKGRYGNATLSQFPIRRERNIDLSVGPYLRRGCQHTTLELPEGEHLEVFNVHLGLLASERARQLRMLARSHEISTLPDGVPSLLAGDTNDWRSLLRPGLCDDMGFRCATDRAHGRGFRCLATFPSFSPRGGLDKIFYRGPLHLMHVATSRLPAARLASDHLPVVADFNLANGTLG